MSHYKIFFDDNNLVIEYQLNSINQEYSIPKIRLGELEKLNLNLYEEDPHNSFWIVHLLEKKWVTKDMLYKIASSIYSYCGRNDINWNETFYVVEKHYYHEAIYINEDRKEKYSGADKVMALIDIGRTEYGKPEIEDGIRTVVKNRLAEIGIF